MGMASVTGEGEVVVAEGGKVGGRGVGAVGAEGGEELRVLVVLGAEEAVGANVV